MPPDNVNPNEPEHEAKLAALRSAISHGMDSGIAEGDVFLRIREKFNLPDIEA